MATKSSNTKGNQYHDEATGQFTSADDVSSGEQIKERKLKLKISAGSDLQAMKDDLKKEKDDTDQNVKSFKIKLKSNLEDMKRDLVEKNQVSSIPALYSAHDIYENIENFFTKSIIKSIDSKFGKFVVPYKYYNLRTDPEQRCGVNIFAACIGKARWKNNYIKIIDAEEYNKLSHNYNYEALWRGIKCATDEEFDTIANSYSSIENEMIYGSCGGTVYGIAVYTSNIKIEAEGYARNQKNHVMKLILNKNAKSINYRSLVNIRDNLAKYNSEIVSKVKDIFVKNGIEDSRATQMARSFGFTLQDEGFIAMLCGIEYYKDGSYHMVENLGSMYRLLDK